MEECVKMSADLDKLKLAPWLQLLGHHGVGHGQGEVLPPFPLGLQ